MKKLKISDSLSIANRLISQNAVKVNGKKIDKSFSSVEKDKVFLLQVGKRRFFKIVVK